MELVHRSILPRRLAQKSLFMHAARGLAWQAAATKGISITAMPGPFLIIINVENSQAALFFSVETMMHIWSWFSY